MTRLKGSQMTAGAQTLFPQIKFDADDKSFGGGNSGNAGYFTPAASFFYVHSLTSDFKLGVATGSYFEIEGQIFEIEMRRLKSARWWGCKSPAVKV